MATQMTQVTQGSTQDGAGGAPQLGPNTYTISGVKVEFPTKAYPSQIAMMNKVIQGLKNNKNCLLESPTGSGKTLALLCAALAWQRHESVRVAEYNAAIDARGEELVQKARAEERLQRQQRERKQEPQEASSNEGTSTLVNFEKEEVKPNAESSSCFYNSTIYELTDDDSDGDFKPIKKSKSESSSPQTSFHAFKGPAAEVPMSPSINIYSSPVVETESNVSVQESPYFVPPEKKLSVPKIFFGTRTHKQIAQITRELRKTYYKTVRSCILASREHTCINPLLDGVSNKNEKCRELMDHDEGCKFQSGARKFGNFNNLEYYGVHPGYDLEDLVKAGKVAKSCPYYATRYLMTNADIIFCPYNYLIDPSIRKSMNLTLENQVLIFDEAHNMEDASREAASYTLKQHEIIKAMQDCEKMKNIGAAEPFALGETATFLSTFSGWMEDQTSNLKNLSHNTSGRFWTGTEVIASLDASGLNENMVKTHEGYFTAIVHQREKEIENANQRGLKILNEKPVVAAATISIIENVFRLFQDMYSNNGLSRDDFRIALIKSTERRRRDVFTGPMQSFLTLTLNIWCLNPAVAFASIRDSVQSIVLTSGTLSPMQSFQSELGTPFALRLEASHVIDKNQVWAGVLGSGPSGISLNGSYQNTESFGYQDEVGAVVQYVCNVMPFGVLCFFPSYRMMDKLVERWKMTGRYRQLEAKKAIVIEPKSGMADFETAMYEFYETINTCDGESKMGGLTGALFLAVCRGKVSEGLDFSDNNARAVICIGIPFPNYKDMQVELKRDYNQKNMNRGLLSGADWYEIQAFRALNQALGRCIRHRQDWGAILLLDDRYLRTPRYIESLSRWIRSSVMNFEGFQQLTASLPNFREEMLARPAPLETSFATQSTSQSQVRPSDSFPVNPGGGDGSNDFQMAFDSSLQFGNNTTRDNGTNGRPEQPLVRFTNAFSSGCDGDCMDSSSNPCNPDGQQLSFPKSVGSSFDSISRNILNERNVPTKNIPTNNDSTKGPGIAAMFARQRERNEHLSTVSEETKDSGNSVLDTTTTGRTKRARERKIKL